MYHTETPRVTLWVLLKGAELIWGGWGKEAGGVATGGWREVLLEGSGLDRGGRFKPLSSLSSSDSDPLQDLSASRSAMTTDKDSISHCGGCWIRTTTFFFYFLIKTSTRLISLKCDELYSFLD